jgi:hypothetical protein
LHCGDGDARGQNARGNRHPVAPDRPQFAEQVRPGSACQPLLDLPVGQARQQRLPHRGALRRQAGTNLAHVAQRVAALTHVQQHDVGAGQGCDVAGKAEPGD